MIADFTIALIGRPNVGKSTLFNRLVGQRLALVDDQPGVTRDRRIGDAKLGDLQFQVIDTAGLEQAAKGSLQERMTQQTEQALYDADMAVMMIDARSGVLPDDVFFARQLRTYNMPLILLANKAEGKAARATIAEAYQLGLGEPIAFSAEHGDGTSDLYDAIKQAMPVSETADIYDDEADMDAAAFDPETAFVDDYDKPLRVAILGRPNAGKSTLINHLIGEERLLTGAEAGITRDSIRVAFRWQGDGAPPQGRDISLWDTAGMRRKSRVHETLEKLSVADGLRAIKFCEVAILLIDATSPFDKQDVQLAHMIEREGRALVIAINKWDLKLDRKQIHETIEDKLLFALPQLKGVPIVFLSGLTGAGVDTLFPAVQKQYELWNARVGTAKLNRWLEEATIKHPPPADKGRPVRLRYMTQAKTRPPSFVIFSSRADAVPASYQRYLANQIRTHFALDGIPLRLFIRKNKNPYVS